uniref:Uncharacterized protein n=1 Tax=Anguilla anguilla TaxID=7936 RepID=A0A0E9W2S6_ANGAN
MIINESLHLYSTFLNAQSALQS